MIYFLLLFYLFILFIILFINFIYYGNYLKKTPVRIKNR